MASATCATVTGIRSAAMPFKVASASCATRVGASSAASPVAWAGSSGTRRARPVLPRIQVKPVRSDGSWNPDVYDALQWLFDQFVGGIGGRTVPEVLAELVRTQAQLQATTTYATQVANYAAAVGSQVSAVAEVAQANSLSGASSIPPDPDPPANFADRNAL